MIQISNLLIRCTVPNWKVMIKTNAPDVVAETILKNTGFFVDKTSSRFSDDSNLISIMQLGTNDKWQLEYEDSEIQVVGTTQLLIAILEYIEWHFEIFSSQFLIFHGAAMRMADLAIFFIAPTCTGKSSMAAYFSAKMSYLSDDYAIFDPKQNLIYGLPSPIFLRELLPSLPLTGQEIIEYHPFRQEKIALFFPTKMQSCPFSPRKVIFIELQRTNESSAGIQNMSTAQLFKAMLFHLKRDSDIAWARTIMPKSISCMVGYRLIYSSFSQAETFLNLLMSVV